MTRTKLTLYALVLAGLALICWSVGWIAGLGMAILVYAVRRALDLLSTETAKYVGASYDKTADLSKRVAKLEQAKAEGTRWTWTVNPTWRH